MLPGATTKSNMVVKHEIERIPLRAHHRQEVELYIHGYQLRGYIYVMCATREDDVSPRQCKLVQPEQCSWAPNQKEVSPAWTACRVFEITLTGCVGVFKGVDA